MRLGLVIDAGLILAIVAFAQSLMGRPSDGAGPSPPAPATAMAEICRVLPSGDIADCTIQN